MEYDLGVGKETFQAYVQPHVSSFYAKEVHKSPKKPRFMGQAGKIVNCSPHQLQLFW